MRRPEAAPASAPTSAPDTAHRRPAGVCVGPGHVIVYGNPAFLAAYGGQAVGLPAREALLDMPPEGFAVMDAAFELGRSLATWIRRNGEDWRLTVAPHTDPETGGVYGIRFHLRARFDLPIVAEEGQSGADGPSE
jgi:hypothetical protein